MAKVTVDTSDLEKVRDVLGKALLFHTRRDDMNAAVHLADTTRYSPLTSELDAACERLEALVGEAT